MNQPNNIEGIMGAKWIDYKGKEIIFVKHVGL